jgi:lipopolysaccharide export system protein LptA
MPHRNDLAIAALCGLLALFPASAVQALSSDKDQPINIEADSVDIDESKGQSVYLGNVQVTQGSIRLLADRVTVFHASGDPEKFIAVGQPAKFRQMPDDGDVPIQARAQRMEYLINGDLVTLIDQAVVLQGKDTMRSDRIVWDRVKGKVKGGLAAQGKERVKMTFQPKKSAPEASE